MKRIARLLALLHLLLVLGMPAFALARVLDQAAAPAAAAMLHGEHCGGSAAPAAAPQHPGHAACGDCLVCAGACLPGLAVAQRASLPAPTLQLSACCR